MIPTITIALLYGLFILANCIGRTKLAKRAGVRIERE